MGALQNLSSCNLLGYQKKVRYVQLRPELPIFYADALTVLVYYQGSSRLNSNVVKERAVDIDKKRSLTSPVLRIVTSFMSLVDSADFLEVSLYVGSTFSSCRMHSAFGNKNVYYYSRIHIFFMTCIVYLGKRLNMLI